MKKGKKEGNKSEQYKKGEMEIESQNAHRCRYTPDGHVVHTVIQKNIQLLAYTLGDYRRTTPKARGVRVTGPINKKAIANNDSATRNFKTLVGLE